MSVRTWLDRHPRVLRFGWTLRIVALQGPWNPVLLAFCRRFARHSPIAATPHSLLHDLDPPRVAERLKRDGWADGFKLPEPEVQRILEFTERSPQQTYDQPHEQCDALHELACDPSVLEVARRYLGGEPVLYNSVIWRNGGVKDPDRVRDSHLYRFHFDVADVKSLVLFVYLSDVDERSGPHVVIRGTHRRRTLRDTLRLYVDEATAQKLYADRITTITGEKGTAFFEEQTIYHKQLIPRGPRTMLRITYTLWRSPAPSSRANAPAISLARLPQPSAANL